jgi:hypothetical protein
LDQKLDLNFIRNKTCYKILRLCFSIIEKNYS